MNSSRGADAAERGRRRRGRSHHGGHRADSRGGHRTAPSHRAAPAPGLGRAAPIAPPLGKPRAHVAPGCARHTRLHAHRPKPGIPSLPVATC